jgi:hypothetical protein
MPEQVIAEGIEESGATDGKVVLKAKADTLVLAANNYRTDGAIVNEGIHDAWLSLGAAAAKEGSGIYLKGGGGSFDLAGFDGEIRGIATEETELTWTQVERPTGGDYFSGTTTFLPKEPTEAQTHAPTDWEQPWGSHVTLDKSGRGYVTAP